MGIKLKNQRCKNCNGGLRVTPDGEIEHYGFNPICNKPTLIERGISFGGMTGTKNSIGFTGSN